MNLVDDRGRLFGRWNVVDALIGVVLLGAIPLLYGGYVLFRPQRASLVAVEPARIQSREDVDLTIRGNNLRPYMRVSFDGHQGQSFLFGDATTAVVRATDLPPGVYDVILYDNAQERARLPKALEVVAPPQVRTEVDIIGSFTALSEPLAVQIKPDLEIAGLGRVTRVGRPRPSATRTMVAPGQILNVPSATAFNVPASIRATCTLAQRSGAVTCVALDSGLIRDIVLAVPLTGATAMFQIDQVHAVGTTQPIEIRARLAGERDVIERVRRGDRDIERGNEFATGAEIVSASAVTRASSSVIVSAQLFPQGSTPSITAGDIATVEVVMRVPAQPTVEGWSYIGQTMKAGRTFVFHGPDYEVSGTVLAVTAK